MFVTCELQGQLGNQMFEIAAAVSYALDYGCAPQFPRLERAPNGALNRHFVFHRLNTEELREGANLYTESCSYYLYEPIPEKENLCLQGYFQNEAYFLRHSEEIRELFSPSQEIIDSIQERYGYLLQGPTVAVHVRTFLPDGIEPVRGIGKENWNYYARAVAVFPEEYTFLVFTDAPEWTKAHFPRLGRKTVFVEGNPHYFDFYLMSLCSHQVVSPKSSFSWWAAWLNPNPEKIVIVPENVIGPQGDLFYPRTWVRVKVD